MKDHSVLSRKIIVGGIILLIIIILLIAVKLTGSQSPKTTSTEEALEAFDDDFVISPTDGSTIHSGETVNLVVQAPSGKSFKRVFTEFLPFPGPESTTSPFTLSLVIPSTFTGPLIFNVRAQATDGSEGFDIFTLNVEPAN